MSQWYGLIDFQQTSSPIHKGIIERYSIMPESSFIQTDVIQMPVIPSSIQLRIISKPKLKPLLQQGGIPDRYHDFPERSIKLGKIFTFSTPGPAPGSIRRHFKLNQECVHKLRKITP